VCPGSNSDPAAICVVHLERREIKSEPASAESLLRQLLQDRMEEDEYERPLRLREPDLRRRPKPPVIDESDVTVEYHRNVKFLKRFPPGTKITELADRMASIVENAQALDDEGLLIYLDVTGKGEPALDLFRQKVSGYIYSVYLTFGDQRIQVKGEITLGKAALVSQLKILFEQGLLHLGRGPDYELLVKELLDYEVHLEPDANNRAGAFKVGSRDEMVTALGIAVHERYCGWR
jgi:hypothetical protein